MSNEFSAAMCRQTFMQKTIRDLPGWRHYMETGPGGLLRPLHPPHVPWRREAPLAGEALIAGDLEAGEVPLAVVIGHGDHPAALGIDGERGVGQRGDVLLLGHEGDLDLPPLDRSGGGLIARLQLVDA